MSIYLRFLDILFILFNFFQFVSGGILIFSLLRDASKDRNPRTIFQNTTPLFAKKFHRCPKEKDWAENWRKDLIGVTRNEKNLLSTIETEI